MEDKVPMDHGVAALGLQAGRGACWELRVLFKCAMADEKNRQTKG